MVTLLVAGLVVWNNAVMSSGSIREFEEGHVVSKLFDRLQQNLDALENQQLAFLLSSKPFLGAGSDRLENEVQKSRAQLMEVSFSTTLQHAGMERIDSMLQNRIDAMKRTQVALVEHGMEAAQALLQKEIAINRDLRREILEIERQIQDTVHERQQIETKRITQIAFLIIALLVLIALVSSWIQRSIHHRLVLEYAHFERQQPLLKKGALQDAIFNSTNFSSIATDAFGVIQIFNVGAERMLGYKAEDVVDKITPAVLADPQEMLERARVLSAEMETDIQPGFDALVYKASRGIEDIYDLTYVRKDRSRFPANVSVTALRDHDGNIIGYLLIGIDNSARKHVEAEQAIMDQRLRDQQFYTRSLIESNIDAMMATNVDGLISDVNQQMEALTGCSRDELIGAPCSRFFTESEVAKDAIARVVSEGKITDYELTILGKDGKQTLVSYNASTFYDRHRQLQGVFAAARDVTERKHFESTLQQNNIELSLAKATAEKANRAKSEFLSSMSHELRTPLNAILGFAQLMASEQPPPSEGQKQSIEQILQGGWYLLRLINEILDLALIESGKVTISQEAMSLTEVLQDCQAMIEPQAQKRGIHMQFPGFDQLFYIHADRMRVKQVMINLLSNAIKYNRESGNVMVSCAMQGEHRVRITVKDTGVGLSRKQIQQLFQPFNRLGQESSAEEGTGIGLVVTKQLVELMGGDIGVESVPGQGSQFWIELNSSTVPALDGVGNEARAVALDAVELLADRPSYLGQSGEQLRSRTLLYVEDNPANLALVEQLVARCDNLSLISAVDGHAGVQLARHYLPDVILMDINLPGISGFGALKILQRDPLTADIPVMALSANAMHRDIETGLNAGFYRYLTKPIKVDEFLEALHSALASAARIQSRKTPPSTIM